MIIEKISAYTSSCQYVPLLWGLWVIKEVRFLIGIVLRGL